MSAWPPNGRGGSTTSAPTRQPIGPEVGAERRAVTHADIDSLYLDTRLVSGAFGTDTTSSIVLLLGNGLAYRGLSGPPSDLTLPPTDQANWADGTPWTRWRTGEDGRPEIASGGGADDAVWVAVDGRRIEAAPPSSERIASGTYQRLRALHAGGIVVTSSERVALAADGRFELSSGSLATSGASNSDHLPTVTLQRDETAEGTTSTVAVNGGSGGDLAVGVSRREVAAEDAARQGSFRMLDDGFGVELSRDDGTVVRQLFFVDGERIFMGDRSYVRVAPDRVAPDRAGAAGSPLSWVGSSAFGYGAARAYAVSSGDSEESADDERRRKRVFGALPVLGASPARSEE